MKRLKQLVLLVFTGIVVASFIASTVDAFQAGKGKPTAKPTTPAPAAPTAAAPDTKPTGSADGKYAQPFDHFAKVTEGKPRDAHDKLATAESCELCHERLDNSPKTPKPYHDSCVKCHANQFTDAKLEVCAGCHSKPYNDKPAVTEIKALNQFGMEFSHSSHKARADFKCETCHNTPADNKTARSSYPAHKECFECHTFNDTKAKGNCNECHNTKNDAQKFRTRGRIDIAYNLFKFNHGLHLTKPRVQATGCEGCHDVLNTDATTKTDVSRINIVFSTDPNKIHKSVCFTCHDPNPPGNGNQCLQCHVRPVGSLTPALVGQK